MAIGDITFYDSPTVGLPASERFAVAASATTIKAGEPVAKALGNSTGNVVTPAATNTPVVATDFFAGIAASTSTNTASAAGTVDVFVFGQNQTYLIAPKVAASWDTQAEYDALVGARVLLDLTASVYTILATDGATSGCVIMPMDITTNPAKVRFAFRGAVSYLA